MATCGVSSVPLRQKLQSGSSGNIWAPEPSSARHRFEWSRPRAAMSHQLNPGLISAYNSLTDKHLAGYFSNTRIRRHLQRAGLITRSGRIVPDKEYRHKQHQRAHQRHVRECLAQAIFHKVLEMERIHQIEIKRKLEEFARRERVLKIKVGRSKRYEEDVHVLSPRPPTAARTIRKQNSGPEGEHSESSESPGSSRPNTAPGNMQRPVRLKPINSHNNAALLRHSSPYRLQDTSNENDHFNCTIDKKSRRRVSKMDPSSGISPYCLPVINNFVTPVPPAVRKCERGITAATNGTVRGRRLRPTTTSTGVDFNEEQTTLRSSVCQRRVCVNMIYYGKTVHLSHDMTDLRDEVKVFQQHCGGENLCVYRGKLREGDMFQFISKRHRGFPFSLTFFLNGLQVERLSSCCEFKHRKGPRLGGRHGHFGFTGVEGASPCYKCIIAMGLDKKPTPPPRRVREDSVRQETFLTKVDTETSRTAEAAAPHSEHETSQAHDTAAGEAPEEAQHRHDYEEDFEADDEGPAEEPKEERSFPSREADKAKERRASESEEEERDEDIRSRSGSSSAGSDVDESEAEVTKEERDDEEAEEVAQEENSTAPEDQDQTNSERATVDKEPEIRDSAGDSTELEISNTSAGNENTQTDDSAGDKEEVGEEESRSEEEEEQERAKSVQEKLAEAILQESRCSSEPELSDTTTEEEEESTKRETTEVAATTCEDDVPVEVETSQDQEESSVAKDQEDEVEPNPHESSEDVLAEVPSDEVKAEKAESISSDSGLKTTDQGSESLEKTADESTAAAVKDEEETMEGEAAPAGQEAESSKEEESSELMQNKTTGMDNAEATIEAETVEVKVEYSELLKSEEEPATDRQKSDDKADVTVENSSCSSEESGDTTVEKKGEEKLSDQPHEDETCDAGEETTEGSGKVDEKLEEDEPEQTDEHIGEVGEEEKDEREEDRAEGIQSEEKVIEEPGDAFEDESESEHVKDDEEESAAPVNQEEEKSGDERDEEKQKDENDNDKEGREDEDEKETVEGTQREEGKCEDAETRLNKETSDDNNVQSEDAVEAAGDEEKDVAEVHEEEEEAGEEEEDAESGERAESSDVKKEEVSDDKTEMSEQREEESKSNEDEEEARRENQEERKTMEPSDEESKTNDAEQAADKRESDELSEEDEGKLFQPGDSKTNHEVDSEESRANEEENETRDGETADSHESRTNQEEGQSKDEAEPELEDRVEAETVPQGEEEIQAEQAVESDSLKTRDVAEESKVDSVPAVYESEKVENQESQSESNTKSAGGSKAGGDSEDEGMKDVPSDLQQSSVHIAAHTIDKSDPESDKWVELNTTSADLEEASKASEEGASVLVQPQTSHKTESSVVHDISEALAEENNVDLVTNWVTMHQTSKYFETFVEPIEDLKESRATRSEAATSGEPLRSESPRTTDEPSAEEGINGGKEEESKEAEKSVDLEREEQWDRTNEEEVKSKTEEVELFEGLEEKKEKFLPFVEQEKKESGLLTFEPFMNVNLEEKPESVDRGEDKRAASPRQQETDEVKTLEHVDDHKPADEQTSASWVISEDVATETTDPTTSKIESQERDEMEPKPFNGSVSGDSEQIQNIKSSKDQISADEGVFGHILY